MSMSAIALRSVPSASGDPFFASVALLIPMNGANGGGTFTDIKGNTLTTGGGTPPVTSTAQSLFGSGSSGFMGTGGFSTGYITTPLSSLLGGTFVNTTSTWTIEVWTYITAYPDGGGGGAGGVANGLGDQDAGSGYSGAWSFGIKQTGAVEFNLSVPPYAIQGGFMPGNQWVFLTAVANNGVVTIYQDGVAVATDTITAPATGSTGLFQIGGRGGTSYPGYFYDLRITLGVARYSSNFTPPTAPFPTS